MAAAPEETANGVVNITINGREVEARQGQTILEAARDAGVEIPTLCYDPRLTPYGACRMCLVEVEGARGPMASCGTTVREGMVVETHSEKILKLRKFVLELLLTNHPLDCPVCEASGDCRLQDYAYEYLVDMVPWGWRAPEETSPGTHPNIFHYGSRCILCGRCVRICREVMSIGCWGYLNRGYESEVDTPYRRPLLEVGCVSCGQCVSTCPVGSITGPRAGLGAREWQSEKTPTVCSYCSNGCELVVHTYRDRLVKVTSTTDSPLNKGSLCVKGRFGQGYADSDDRLLTPLVRTAAGELREASWDDALARVAEEFQRAKAQGGSGFALLCGTHCTNEAAYSAQKLARAVIGSNNIASSDQAERRLVEKVMGATLGIEAPTIHRDELDKTDVMLVIGSNITESHPVLALSVIKAIRGGKTVIVIDPRRTEVARRASTHMAVKPGSDASLLKGMLAHIFARRLEDAVFMRDGVEGYESLRQSLADVDVEAEAAAAGVEVSELQAVAEAFAQADAGAILIGSGVVGAPQAEAALTAAADLAIATGNVGRIGAGILPLASGANSQGLADMGIAPDRLPGGVRADDEAARARFDAAWGSESGATAPGATLDAILGSNGGAGVECLYVIGADPALFCADEAETRRRLEEVPFLVVQDAFLSTTAALADVVLPAAVSVEDEGTFTNGEHIVQRLRRARAPQGQSLPDIRIIQMVANKMGADWAAAEAGDVMLEIADLVPAYRDVPEHDFSHGGSVVPAADADRAVSAADGGAAKMELLPIPATPASAPTDDTLLILVTGTVLQHHETGVRSRRAEGLTKLNAGAVVEINAADAAGSGIEDEMRVRVQTPSGAAIELPAMITGRVPAGVVFIPGFDPEAPVNRLFERGTGRIAHVKVEPA